MPNDRYDLELASGRIAASFHVGERMPVVALHGNSASKTVFMSQIAALRAEGFGVLALDLPGHGDSADAKDPSRTYSFPATPRWLPMSWIGSRSNAFMSSAGRWVAMSGSN